MQRRGTPWGAFARGGARASSRPRRQLVHVCVNCSVKKQVYVSEAACMVCVLVRHGHAHPRVTPAPTA
jgi:hypothetical protein